MNKRCLSKILLSLLFFIVAPSVFALAPVARIVYIEGAVFLQRDGDTLNLQDSDIGIELFAYDFIETGDDGFVEVELVGYSRRGTILKVEKCSAFYFNDIERNGSAKTTVQMMAGTISFRVQKLAENEALNVQTETALMGVRGTDFIVKRAPDGSVLVVCVEGKVACEDDRHMERYAMPGSIVEKRPGSPLSRVDIDVGDENLYELYWSGKREEVFRAGAESFTRGYSSQYNSYLPRFLSAYEALLSVKRQLENSDRESNELSKLITVKADTTDEVIMMCNILPLFEHSFYAVQVLEKYYEQGEIQSLKLDRHYTSDDFFNDFMRRKDEIKNKLADIRYCMKLYDNISHSASVETDSRFSPAVEPLEKSDLPLSELDPKTDSFNTRQDLPDLRPDGIDF